MVRHINRLTRQQRAQRRFFNPLYEARRYNEILEPGSTDSGAENYYQENLPIHAEVEHRALNEVPVAPVAAPQRQEPDVPAALDDTYAVAQGQIHAWDDSHQWEPFNAEFLEDVDLSMIAAHSGDEIPGLEGVQRRRAQEDQTMEEFTHVTPDYKLWFPAGYRTPKTLEEWDQFVVDYGVEEFTPPVPPSPTRVKLPYWTVDSDGTPSNDSSSDPLSGEFFTGMFSERPSFARLNTPERNATTSSSPLQNEPSAEFKGNFAKKTPGRRIVLRTYRGLPSPQNPVFSDSYLTDGNRYTWCEAENYQTPRPRNLQDALKIVDSAYQADIANLILMRNELARKDSCMFVETTAAVFAVGNGAVFYK